MPRHIESEIQQACMKWFALQFRDLEPLMFAIPNEGARSVKNRSRMKAEGMKAGVADVLFLYPNKTHHGLCIEFKTKKGRQQPSQKLFEQEVSRRGYRYEIVRSIEDFIALVKNYIYDTPKS